MRSRIYLDAELQLGRKKPLGYLKRWSGFSNRITERAHPWNHGVQKCFSAPSADGPKNVSVFSNSVRYRIPAVRILFRSGHCQADAPLPDTVRSIKDKRSLIKDLWAICRCRGVQQKARRRRMRGAWPAAHHVLVGDLEQRAADSARGHRDAGHHRHVLVAGLLPMGSCTRFTTLFQV